MPRSDPAAHREQIRRANKGRYRATNRLIEECLERFDAIYAEEAAREDVAPKSVKDKIERAAAAETDALIGKAATVLAEVAPVNPLDVIGAAVDAEFGVTAMTPDDENIAPPAPF
jgi:hypothetical protein